MTHTETPWQRLKGFDISIDGDAWGDGRTINGWVIVGSPDDKRFAIAILDIGHPNQWDDETLYEVAELVKSLPLRVNTHDDLVKALEGMTALAVKEYSYLAHKGTKEGAVLDAARAALAKAKGGAA